MTSIGKSQKQVTTVKKRTSFERSKAKWGVIFTLPWILGFLIFFGYPLISSIYYSFTTYSVLDPGKFVGLKNYIDLFHDHTFWIGIYNTIYYTVFSVPLGIIFGVGLALMLNVKIRGQGIYRTIFFIPTLVPLIATSIIWQWLLNPQFGLVNGVLAQLGINGPPWLGSPAWAKPSLILMSQWGIGNAVIIYLAGLQDISQEYYDAAEVDGANWWQKTIKITLPLMSPVIFFNLVMGIINALQIFTLPYALTNGAGTPANSLMFYGMYLYNNAFGYMKMGYASAMAWILFLVIMGLTLIVFRSSNSWVNYQGE